MYDDFIIKRNLPDIMLSVRQEHFSRKLLESFDKRLSLLEGVLKPDLILLIHSFHHDYLRVVYDTLSVLEKKLEKIQQKKGCSLKEVILLSEEFDKISKELLMFIEKTLLKK